MIKHIYSDGNTVELLSDTSLRLILNHEEFIFSEEDKARFLGLTGETVIEYEGLTTDENAKRSFAKASFEPQGTSPSHYHNELTEVYYIFSGTAEVTIDGYTYAVNAGEQIEIPPGSTHQVKNPSDTEPMDLLVICVPAWTANDFHPNEMPVPASYFAKK